MTVREDAVQTVVAIALKEADAAVVVTPSSRNSDSDRSDSRGGRSGGNGGAVQAQTEDPDFRQPA